MGEVAVAEAGDSVPVGAAVAEQLREAGGQLYCKFSIQSKLREAGAYIVNRSLDRLEKKSYGKSRGRRIKMKVATISQNHIQNWIQQ